MTQVKRDFIDPPKEPQPDRNRSETVQQVQQLKEVLKDLADKNK